MGQDLGSERVMLVPEIMRMISILRVARTAPRGDSRRAVQRP